MLAFQILLVLSKMLLLILSNNLLLLISPLLLINLLYFFNGKSVISLWHSKLGHPSSKALQQVLTKLHISSPSSDVEWCDSCMFGKMLPFSKTAYNTSSPFEPVFTDIWGSAPVVSVEGYR
ncbi:hypothetical protein ACOSQ4_030592 [Xanthoceras sorbifolium]